MFQPSEKTLHHPRILCLHGGGVNAEIFRLQSRNIITALEPYFRLVFADGPFLCNAGPGMIPVYSHMGPYRRWLRWLPEHAELDDDDAIDEIEYQMRGAMAADDALGATGEWVGLMGFSQGSKVAASLLYESQLRRALAAQNGVDGMYGGWEEENIEGIAGGKWQFAVLMAGRAPLVKFSKLCAESRTMVTAGGITEGFTFDLEPNTNILTLPTVHVHGLKDPGLHLHRKLLDDYCHPRSVKIVEWDGDHRIPIKSLDVKPVVDATLLVAKQCGILRASQLPAQP